MTTPDPANPASKYWLCDGTCTTVEIGPHVHYGDNVILPVGTVAPDPAEQIRSLQVVNAGLLSTIAEKERLLQDRDKEVERLKAEKHG